MNLDIYRGTSIWLTIKTDDNTRLIRQLLGEDIIKSSFNSHIFLDINIGDYIVYDGVIYYVNNLPNIKKNSSNSFDYNIIFESEYYELLKTQFLDSDGNSDFSLVGNLETFIDLIVTNMDREHTGWAKGTWNKKNDGIEDWPSALDYKLLSFSKSNCMQVLQKLCDEFEGEFYFEFALDFIEGAKLPYYPAGEAVIGYKPAAEAEHGYKPAEGGIISYTKDICFTDKAGSDSGLTFKYHQGLRNIHRTTLSEKNIITRLYAFGSKKNLASDYRDYSRRLKFVTDGKSYLEKNIDKYGIIEHTEIFNDIYPHREGIISSVNPGDITKFTDVDMFDLNACLLPGITAKLHFNSGDLGGYEFEVSRYNTITKEFTIIAFTDERGYEMPNTTLKPAGGNKYVLLDIKMPQVPYIDDAETILQDKAQTYINDNCEPRVTYILEPDWRNLKTGFIELKVGDFITIEDTDLGMVDPGVMTRIIELTKSLANEYKYTLKLTDHLEVQLIQRLYSEQEDLKKKIEIDDGGDIIRARRNWKTSEELRTMVFDTDGYFDMGNIRPASIETGMLSVGSKSTQYILKEVLIEANYTDDVSKFHASAGELIHLSIADEIRTWTLFENSRDDLVDETAYYIYVECTKEPIYSGRIIIDETQRKFDDDEIYYYFLIGVLHSVVDGVRGISLTYGQTIINGGFIQTGSITADKYNELRNTYVFNGDDSLDATYPFELDFEIVSEMTAINSVKLSFRIRKFRAYSTGAASGGGSTPTSGASSESSSASGGGQTPTSSAGGAQTSSASSSEIGDRMNCEITGGLVAHEGGYYYSSIPDTNVVSRVSHTHTVANHQHTVTVVAHTHGIAHTHIVTIVAHTHGIIYGIYEESQSPTINVYVSNDGINYGSSIGAYTTDKLDIPITGISGSGWKKIKFTSNVRARISAIILVKIDLSA